LNVLIDHHIYFGHELGPAGVHDRLDPFQPVAGQVAPPYLLLENPRPGAESDPPGQRTAGPT
jgi:hypothetical protein